MMEKQPYRTYLSESEIPTSWYNLRADMAVKPGRMLLPNGAEARVEDVAPVFAEELCRQELDDDTAEFEIPDLRRRIAEVRKEIETVVSTEPYTFRSLLSSPAAIRKKRAELRVEIKAWESHLEQLRGLWNSNGAEQRSDGKWLVN